MSKSDWIRLLLHLPWGLLGAWPLSWAIFVPTMAVLFLGLVASTVAIGLMVCYEAFNDWRKGDSSYKDVLGIVWGYLLGMIAIGIWLLG